MDLSLNADAALRAYLPPESWNGDAQHRFIFRTKDGEVEPLLARLAVLQTDDTKAREFDYCVLIRPERAESERIFYVYKFNYWETTHTAPIFHWSSFEQNFYDDEGVTISRFWLKRAHHRDVVLRVDSKGWGKCFGFEDEEAKRTIHSQRFRWFDDEYIPMTHKDLRFLRQTNAAFHLQMQSWSDDPRGEIDIALKWQYLTHEERNATTFHCLHGAWGDLISLATSALTVRIVHWNRPSNQHYRWNLTRTYVLADDPFLNRWRTALIKIFQPNNVNVDDGLAPKIPLCMWDHIVGNPLCCVHAHAPSHHELLEAQLQLRDWANAHFPPEEAQRLLSL